MNEVIMTAIIEEILKSYQTGDAKEKALALKFLTERENIVNIYNKLISESK